MPNNSVSHEICSAKIGRLKLSLKYVSSQQSISDIRTATSLCCDPLKCDFGLQTSTDLDSE